MAADLDVIGTPYYLPSGDGGSALRGTFAEFTQRIEALRGSGKLSEETLRAYFGQKRFEQVAESNAIEGNPLSAGETELAIVRGITISGHDPAFSRDAQALGRAIEELVVLARSKEPTNITQVRRIHELVLAGRPTAGSFRNQEVRIAGAAHRPPRTITEILDQMEQWERWSSQGADHPPLLRAVVLHAWLAHIHPFIDGNGRTARAVSNLEFIRAGYPAIIIRRKDRTQYLDALARADSADLGPMVDLMAGRLDDALRDLERAATRHQEYDAHVARARHAHQSRLDVWNAGVALLRELLKQRLEDRLGADYVELKEMGRLELDDFLDLCDRKTVRNSWAFTLKCTAPAMPSCELLAWTGFAGDVLQSHLSNEPGRPVLMWSERNRSGYPPWRRIESNAPGGEQLTIRGDSWLTTIGSRVEVLRPSELADRITASIAARLLPPSTL